MTVLSRARADRLARRAVQRRPDGTRNPLARRAWRILVRAGDAGEEPAMGAMWTMFLRHVDRELWDCLIRWRYLMSPLDTVFWLALDPMRPAEWRAAVLEFYRRHGLAPNDPVDRALFFVLTGQPEQHQAADPDGSLLAVGYRDADPEIQAVLRKAMVETGSLSLVRVIADRRDLAIADQEIEYVLGRLAQHEEWPRLWRLARDLRLDQAVAAVRLASNWRPADPAGRELCDRLAAADPEAIATVVAGAYARIRSTVDSDTQWRFSLAPDGSEMALSTGTEIVVCSLPDGRTVASFPLPENGRLARAEGGSVVHLGDAVVYDENVRRVIRRRRPQWAREVIREGYLYRLAAVPGGFVVGLSGKLGFGTADGTGVREVSAKDLGLAHARRLTIQATERESDLLAVTASHRDLTGRVTLAVLDSNLRVVGRADAYSLEHVHFAGPNRLLGTGSNGQTSSWHREGGTLVLDASTVLNGHLRHFGTGPVALSSFGDGRLIWLDPKTLEPIDAPDAPPRPLWILPGGAHALFRSPDGIEVRDLRLPGVAEVLGRPMAHAQIADLASVARAAAEVGDSVREAVQLLQACLEYRFGTEIEVGPAAPSSAGDDDIVLGCAG